jgi:endonuclease/exonuclease/phosphatase family metal-dependent hydrolase
LINELVFHTRQNPESFICLQEVLHNQLEDILYGLNSDTGNGSTTANSKQAGAGGSEWTYIGVGRDDGHEAGEYSPIIYRPAIWKLEHSQTVWLSETPSVPSRGWDAATMRILTIGIFKHYVSRKAVLAMNTHLDDQGSKARLEAARLILRQVDNYISGGYADRITGVFLAGDFNSEEKQEAYSIITEPGSPFRDTQKQVDPRLRYGNENTYTGFGYDGARAKRIDYIFLAPGFTSVPEDHLWAVRGYSVLPSRFDDGVYNSDHRAVVTDTELR